MISRKLLAFAMATALAGSGGAVLAGQGDQDHRDRDHEDRDHRDGDRNRDRDHDNGHWRDKHRDHDDDDDRRGYGFADHDRNEIRGWYADHHRHLPPGLARRDRLPVDLENRLVIRAAFPRELESRVMVVPADLDRRMAPPPPDCERVLIGGHIVLRNRSTKVVIDIFHFE